MQISGSFSVLLVFSILAISVASTPVPTPVEDGALAARVVDARVGRQLKQYKPKRSLRVARTGGYGYDDNDDDDDEGGRGRSQSRSKPGDKGRSKSKGKSPSRGRSKSKGRSKSRGKSKSKSRSRSRSKSPKPPKPSSWAKPYNY